MEVVPFVPFAEDYPAHLKVSPLVILARFRSQLLATPRLSAFAGGLGEVTSTFCVFLYCDSLNHQTFKADESSSSVYVVLSE
jgi:hypothetical protein